MVARKTKRYRPTVWTFLAGGTAIPGLLVWYVALHPEIWGGREFEGMIETLVAILLTYWFGFFVLVFSVIGMIRRDLFAFAVFVVVAFVAVVLFAFRSPHIHLRGPRSSALLSDVVVCVKDTGSGRQQWKIVAPDCEGNGV